MDSIDELDYLTVEVLIQAGLHSVAGAIVEHPKFAGGITDNDRVLVIGAFAYREGGADAVTKRISRGEYAVEPREFSTPRTPQLVVTVARDRDVSGDYPGVGRLTRDSVANMEDMMGEPFPLSHVLLFVDAGMFTDERVAGYNFGMLFMAVNSRFPLVVLNDTVIHEVAHYYWIGAKGAKWLTEGMAELAAYVFGSGAENPKGDCEAKNLSELSLPRGSDCPYYLGQQLFVKLKEAVGEEEFRAGIRRLYDVLENKRYQDGESWIDHLRAAFKDSPQAQLVINQAWNGAALPPVVPEASDTLGRLGVRQVEVVSTAVNSAEVLVNPDLADSNGDVWLLAYRCETVHGDAGCPKVDRPATNGYDLPVGPDFAVRVRFTESSGLMAADLREVCHGEQCDIVHPWLRQAEPSGDGCAVQMGADWDTWPDRVIRGGGCNFYGTRFGSVDFGADGQEKFVVYSTGGNGDDIELVPVYGVFEDATETGEQLGSVGLNEHRMDVAAGGSDQVWLRSEMADDDGNVWLFVYRCNGSFDDDGCPLVGRDSVRPSYDIDVRPAFVVRVGFLAGGVSGTLDAVCSGSTCTLTAVFRDAAGNKLPGTAEFRVDRGGLGLPGSTALSSWQSHTVDAMGGYSFMETLQLPASGMVTVHVELVGDGTVLEKRVGTASSVQRLSARVMRCSGDEATCHEGALVVADTLSRGDRFVIEVTGYDAAGDVGLSAGRLSQAACTAGPVPVPPVVSLSTNGLRSYNYGTSQRADHGYAGCAYQVTNDAAYGSHGYTVSFNSGGAALSASGEVTVGRSAGDLAYLGVTGPSRLESGETGDYRVFGYNSAGLPVSVAAGCVDVTVSGALSGAAACFVEGISSSGQEFTVTADDVVLDTDSSVGVTYGDLSARKHVLVTPAEEDSAPVPVVGDSHISSLAIEQEDTQLRISWVGSPTAAFASMRAQVWVKIGDVDEFLPGCMGGEPHDVSTHEVFCLLSYGQSGDVYHVAVGYIRHDGSAVPVETAQWVRP